MEAEHLLKIGELLSSTCPSASRFYISNFEKRRHENPNYKKQSYGHLYCHHCGSIWNSKNMKVYTQSPQHVNHHIKKLLKMERNEVWKLNSQQKKKLRRFYNSSSKIAYKCLICQKVTYFPGSKCRKSVSHVETNTSTPANTIKLNKKELHAGLFIAASPISLNEKSNPKKLEASPDISTEMTEGSECSYDSSNISVNTKECMDNSSKGESSFSYSKDLPKLNSSKQSVKRKKTLLAQILNQEQSKKKKTSLSSFLVSL